MKKRNAFLATVLTAAMMTVTAGAGESEKDTAAAGQTAVKPAVSAESEAAGESEEALGEGFDISDSFEEETEGSGESEALSSEALASEGFVPEDQKSDRKVIGTDDRQTITDTFSYPFSAIALIEEQCPVGGEWYTGTGFMVSPNTLMTAGHMLFCTEHNCEFNNMQFYYGVQPDHSYSYMYDGAYDYYYSRKYLQTDSTTTSDWDFAYIVFKDEDVGYTTGWLATRTCTQEDFVNGTITSIQPVGYRDDLLKVGSGTVLGGDAKTIEYDADAVAGNSGGPVFANGTDVVIGIHVAESVYMDYNIGRLITDGVLESMSSQGLIQLSTNVPTSGS